MSTHSVLFPRGLFGRLHAVNKIAMSVLAIHLRVYNEQYYAYTGSNHNWNIS